MMNNELKNRTKKFALEILKLVEQLPNTQTSRVIGNQILRSSTSVAANYRAACRAKSPKDFIYKMGIVEEESDETLFWLEMIQEAALLDTENLKYLMNESNELTAIFVSSLKTAKRNHSR
jgi:four helix bundle protein